MIEPLTDNEIQTMRQAGKVAAAILKKIGKILQPGITTKDIEKFFDNQLANYSGMTAAFKGFHGYPASICVSLNEEIIHGIPSEKRTIHSGDLVSVDLGIKYKGLFVDTAYTFIVNKATPIAKKLINIAQKSLYLGIAQAKNNYKTGDIGNAIQRFVERHKFSVIRKFVGHGIGKELHLPPEVPNFGIRGNGEKLEAGFAIAIEPMITTGNFDVDILADGWTVKTKDNSLAAHFEHTVVITNKGPIVITK